MAASDGLVERGAAQAVAALGDAVLCADSTIPGSRRGTPTASPAGPRRSARADGWRAARALLLAGSLVVAISFAAGLALMALPEGGPGLVVAQGLLVGLGLAGTTFPIVMGAVGRVVQPERRSLAFGIVLALG